MHLVKQPGHTSLAVGFPGGESVPEKFLPLVGRTHRVVAAGSLFPFEDSQFEVVILAPPSVNAKTVREAHRVLRPNGLLVFSVPEKTRRQEGFTLPDIYRTLREGFNIVEVERPPWWFFGRGGRTISICAEKKNWRSHVNTYRPYV